MCSVLCYSTYYVIRSVMKITILSKRSIVNSVILVGLFTIILTLVQLHYEYSQVGYAFKIDQSSTHSLTAIPNQSSYQVHYSEHYSEKQRREDLEYVSKNIDTCLQASGLSSSSSQVTKAKDNAHYFLREYRRVIPKTSLDGYRSHCWNTNYQASRSGLFSLSIKGNIGGLEFDQRLPNYWFGYNSYMDFVMHFGGHFSTTTVCIPRTFILGFAKCGTSFLWCFISKLVQTINNKNQHEPSRYQSNKEPSFWTHFDYAKSLPDATSIGNPYLLNFLEASKPDMKRNDRKEVLLIDGTPTTSVEWPNFRVEDPELANYCLLPSTLPQLLPESKYIIIMRNPVSMLYSKFWWSYRYVVGLNSKFFYALWQRSRGPDIFHKKVLNKIDEFNRCMRDELNSRLCDVVNSTAIEYSTCIRPRLHLLSKCVHSITEKRDLYEIVVNVGVYYAHVRKWFSILSRDRLLFLTMEDLVLNNVDVTKQLLKFLNLDNYTGPPLNEDAVKKIASSCSTNPNFVVNYKSNPQLSMREDTEQMLKRFYYPFNSLLSELLGDPKFNWNDS